MHAEGCSGAVKVAVSESQLSEHPGGVKIGHEEIYCCGYYHRLLHSL